MPHSLFDWMHLSALAVMLSAASWRDATVRRIPNPLVLWSALIALGLSLSPHGIGLGSAILGGMVGFFTFFIFYLLRVLGAGDVKLAAATGLFLGHPDMLWVSLLILLAGGILSIFWALFTGQLSAVFKNLRYALTQHWLSWQHGKLATKNAFPLSRTRMPYAVAIFAGTAFHVLRPWIND